MRIEDPESNPADVAEQQRPAGPGHEPDPRGGEAPLEADPADVAEQQAEVPIEDADELG
jgi:hypothetical protein